MNINKTSSNKGVYETPYIAGGTHVGSRSLVIEFEKIMYEADTILIVSEQISSVHTAIERVKYFHDS